MENNHKPSQAKDGTLEQGSKRSLWTHLLAYYPWLFLTGLLVISLAIAAFASYNLIQVGDLAVEAPDKIPDEVIEEPIGMPSENNNPIPLWMVVLVALSCGSGCWLILRSLKRPKKLQKIQNHTQPAQNRNRKLKRRLPRKSAASSLKRMASKPPETKHHVTVLPPEASHPLDTNTESLADLLDIRKQSSLSSILRQS